jgi:hypothetical protein
MQQESTTGKWSDAWSRPDYRLEEFPLTLLRSPYFRRSVFSVRRYMHASSDYFHGPDKVPLKILVYNETGQEMIREREIKQDFKRGLTGQAHDACWHFPNSSARRASFTRDLRSNPSAGGGAKAHPLSAYSKRGRSLIAAGGGEWEPVHAKGGRREEPPTAP